MLISGSVAQPLVSGTTRRPSPSAPACLDDSSGWPCRRGRQERKSVRQTSCRLPGTLHSDCMAACTRAVPSPLAVPQWCCRPASLHSCGRSLAGCAVHLLVGQERDAVQLGVSRRRAALRQALVRLAVHHTDLLGERGAGGSYGGEVRGTFAWVGACWGLREGEVTHLQLHGRVGGRHPAGGAIHKLYPAGGIVVQH